MSNLSALKQILTALGGTPAASDSNDETIAKTATALGTKEFLPSVTSEDKGKVPTVSNDGEWELATPSGGGGGGGVLVCTVDDDTGTLDHTWQEIDDAPCAVIYGNGIRAYLVRTNNVEPPYTVQFMHADDSPQLYVDTLYADSADDYPEFRDFGGGDNGGGGGR